MHHSTITIIDKRRLDPDNLCKLFDKNYVELLKFYIRNIRVLNQTQMEFIKTLPHETKDELFEIYNQCIQLFNDVIS